ncbi:MAG: HD domain-containing protein [Candidatus Magasanikbacteria bacterium]|nr:HD domain-containing protein [Candidatus Magasanikbacteria bacterium]
MNACAARAVEKSDEDRKKWYNGNNDSCFFGVILRDLLKNIFQVSTATSAEAYLVGGVVRDQLLGVAQSQDIDVVVIGSGLAFARAFDERVGHIGSLVEFPDFDTARYVFTEGEDVRKRVVLEVEFAGARHESYVESSRKPLVAPTTLEQDLRRRDFTVNAMARKIQTRGLGRVIDLFDGEKDLREKILRTPLDPDQTFYDDPLRLLRAARFASQLEFSIERETLSAMARHAERLKIVSAERIKEELFKLLGASQPSVGLWILYGTKLLDEFLPEISALSGVEEVFGYTHKDNLSHTLAVVDNIASYSPSPLLRYAGLLHDVAKPATKKFIRSRGWTFDMHEHLGKKMARDISHRLRFSVNESRYVSKLIRWHLQPIALMDEGITDSAVRRLMVNVGDELSDLLILCRSDITTGNQKKKERRLKNYDQLEQRIAAVIEKDSLRAFQSPVRGEEIMLFCGLKPGPTVGKIKRAIEEAILNGQIPNEYEAAKKYFENIKAEYLSRIESWEKAE